MHIFDWSAASLATGGRDGEGKGEEQEGRGREEEVNYHAQLKLPIGYGRPDFNRFRVIHRCDGQTDRWAIA